MKSFRAIFSYSLAFAVTAALLTTTAAFAAKTHSSATATSHRTSAHKTHGRKVAKSHKLHGQQTIDAQRVTQIQQALIREHYLTGDASGQWDSTTQAAMQKYQADQGWQTRLMPDSRALVKLGLGPDYSTAINAKDSSFSAPPPPPASSDSTSISQTAGFAAAAGVNR